MIRLSHSTADKHNIRKNWRTVQIPEGLCKEIENFLNTDKARSLGINTISGYVAYALRTTLVLK